MNNSTQLLHNTSLFNHFFFNLFKQTTPTMENPSKQSIVHFDSVLTESKRIINAHSGHYLALSALFLLPLSFTLAYFPTLLHTFTSPAPNHTVSLLFLSFSLLFASFVVFLSLLGVASITYSVYHGFCGRPVKLWHAIRSLKRSFFPLLGTLITTQYFVLVMFVLYGGSGYVGVKGFELIFGGLSTPYFVGVCVIGVVFVGLVLVEFSLNWALVNVVVVVESRWGYEALDRSKNLIEGMRSVAFTFIILFGVSAYVLLVINTVVGLDDASFVSDNVVDTLGFVLRMLVTSAVFTLLLLYSIAATTVLYMNCKALHGELAGEIAHEFAAEYVSLPFDDQKSLMLCVLCIEKKPAYEVLSLAESNNEGWPVTSVAKSSVLISV